MKKQVFLNLALVLFMAVGLVNLDFSKDLTEMISIGADTAEARRSGGSSGGGFRSSSRSYSSSRSTTTSRPKATVARPSKSVAKPAPRKGDAATQAAKRSQSQVKAATAKPTITSSSGKSIKVAGTPASKSVRSMSSAQYSSRNTRQASTYHNRQGMRTPAERTVIINRYGGGYYGDPYSGLFMYSLLSMSLHNQAMYHHNHWNSYSAQRQQQLLAENAALKAEMAGIANQPRNADYVPEGVDKDLMYSDEFVNAAYNSEPPVADSGWGFGSWFLFLTSVGILGFGGYYVFFRRTSTAV